ncbi:MAG: UDP-N-acetylmuramoyl-L-alanyl-D-glutamate--2,6-diaminopimelate ligase [Cyclobacteriaceae bacterium]|nr:UDP-N-acetylmuramoyl-L-alanyl-D-glutamate--2,6-diaminopimelate ligase [Cyclobacteriaceae bacterium]
MAKLQDILYGVKLLSIHGSRELDVPSLAFDSRKVQEGGMFVAVKGLQSDGHDFISNAIAKGARSVLCGKMPDEITEGVTYVLTDDTTQALGVVASNFYQNPSRKLKLVGLTGTNGKTTSATLLFELFVQLGYTVGLISTVENKIGQEVLPSNFTTPDAIALNELLSKMVEAGCTHAFMEVSSHALVQGRVAGIQFAGGVFTNITHDHLDYHQTFDAYIAAKKLLFDGLHKEAFALVNGDDKRGAIMLQNCKAGHHTFSIKCMSDFKGKIIHNTLQGIEMELNGTFVWFRLIGAFNAYNLLGVFATAVLLGEEPQQVLTHLSEAKGARGRFEYIPNTSQVLAIVDYAHTPDALDNVLQTIMELRTQNEQLITVVGCGGDRDRTKRPKMASIAHHFSDKVILTSDNPRSEDPEAILDEMFAGIPKSGQRKVMRIVDRKEAIRTACNLAGPQDIILVAGKGHETYQEIKGVKYPFDDKEILIEMLNVR